jgi:hypothetical protein
MDEHKGSVGGWGGGLGWGFEGGALEAFRIHTDKGVRTVSDLQQRQNTACTPRDEQAQDFRKLFGIFDHKNEVNW